MTLIDYTVNRALQQVGVQLLARIVSAVCGIFTARIADAAVYGTAHGPLQVPQMLLPLMIDPLRAALARYPHTLPLQPALNTAFLPFLLSAPPIAGLTLVSLTISPSSLTTAIAIASLAALASLASEPLVARLALTRQHKRIAAAQAAAVLAKAFTSLTLSLHLPFSLIPFPASDLVSALVLILILIPSKSSSRLLPTPSPPNSAPVFPYPHPASLAIAKSLFAHVSLKFFLSNADSLIVTCIANPLDQAAFTIASNYGSTLPRLLFAPIEESARDYFATPNSSQPLLLLSSLFRFYFYLSSLLLAFAIPYLPLFLTVFGSHYSSSISPILTAYIFYLPILAYNGIAEAFVTATANSSALKTQNSIYVACSIISALAAFTFLHCFSLGPTGLVLTNAFSLLLRCIWSLHYISTFFDLNIVTSSLKNLKLHALLSLLTYSLTSFLAKKWSASQITSFNFFLSGCLIAFPYILIRINRIAPLQPQFVRGTVNDPTPIPDPNRAHGSYHWTFERLVSIALIPLVVTPFAAGSLNPVTDAILASSLVIHSHIGFHSILTDYLPKRIYPKIAKTAGILLKSATALVLLGLYEFQTNDVGITEMIKRVWQA